MISPATDNPTITKSKANGNTFQNTSERPLGVLRYKYMPEKISAVLTIPANSGKYSFLIN